MESVCDQIEQQYCSASCNIDELAGTQQLQRYMGTYNVRRSCMSSSATRVPEASFSKSCAGNSCSIVRRLPAAGADVRVPALHCSFTASLHPEYETVKAQCDEWILGLAQPSSAAARHLLQECVLPRLLCRNVPNASSITRLVHATKMASWLIISDDDDDHPEALGADDINTAHYASQVLSILRDIHAPASEATCGKESPTISDIPSQTNRKGKKREAVLLAGLAELWAEMREELSPRLSARFVSTMEAYLRAVKVQAIYRRANRLPDIQAYKEIRRHASFIPPCFVLMEYALGIDLDDATYANERIQEFRNTATDYIWLCNDLISCKMEMEVGDYFNMPSIVYACTSRAGNDFQRGGLTLQGAVERVADMAYDMDARCVSMLQTMFDHEDVSSELAAAAGSRSAALVNGGGASNSASIRKYVSGICNCMSGSLAWHLETARYKYHY